MQYTQALENYQQAIAFYDISLQLKYIGANEFDKARIIEKLGQCLEQLLRYEEAFSCYQTILEIFNRLLPKNDKYIKSVEQQIQKLSAQLN